MSKELEQGGRLREPAMPAVLALLRHGQSVGQYVAEQEKQGDFSAFTEDFRNTSSALWDLTHTGFRQARQASGWMNEFVVNSTVLPASQFDKGYFSPHTRARQTMGAVLLAGLVENATVNERLSAELYEVNQDLRLRELDFGEVSTIPRHEFHSKYPESVWARKVDPVYGRTPGGESVADVMDRTRSFLGALTRAHTRGVDAALVVSHGRQIRSTQLALEGIDPLNWRDYDSENEIKNCQVVLYSRRDPETGDEYPTFRWTSSTCPWETFEPPTWREFSAPTAMSAEDCLQGIPREWLDEPLS
jgi:broad specificity phosphatase PhoE